MILDGTALAKKIGSGLKRRTRLLRERGVIPKLSIILVGDNAASALYAALKEHKALELGVACQRVHFPSDIDPREVRQRIDELNQDSSIHGIILQLPLPDFCADQGLEDSIVPEKDIDCLCATNLSRLAKGLSPVGGPPPTAESVLRLITAAGVRVKGTAVAIVGAGFFGRQIALHCVNQGATITVADIHTKDLRSMTRPADVVVSVVGKPNVITGDMVKAGAVVIDAGISRVRGKTVGDVNFGEVARRAAWVTPVPGGVGPVTVVLLMENVIRAAERTTLGDEPLTL